MSRPAAPRTAGAAHTSRPAAPRTAGRADTIKPASPRTEQGTPRPAVEEVRGAVTAMLGAERRLRSRDHGRPGELTVSQIRALAALGRGEEMTAGQLARSADLNPASVTALIDHLEGAGVVERQRSTEDRRVCHVALTDQGRRLLKRKLSVWQRAWDERLSGFSDRELEAAARVVREVAGLLDAVGQPPSR